MSADLARIRRALRALSFLVAALVPATAQQAMVERSTLLPQPHGPYANFGRAVALDGGTLAIGSTGQEMTFVFARDGGSWSQQAALYTMDRTDGDRFGDAVDLDGDVLVVGAARQDSPSGVADAGAAYVFERDAAGAWTLLEKVGADDASSGAWFGVAVSVDGDRILVGADQDEEAGPGAGAAYVFRRTPVGFVQEQKLLPTSPPNYARYGSSVSIEGGTALLGGNHPALIFERDAQAWHAKGRLVPRSTPGAGSRDLARSGRRVAVGDPFSGVGGLAWVFDLVQGTWREQAELVAADVEPGDWFGALVAVDGDRVVVGDPYDDDPLLNAGSAYVFEKVEGVWSERVKLHAVRRSAHGGFGWRAAIEADTVIVTDYGVGPAGALSGSAHEFVLPPIGRPFGAGDGSGTACPCGNEEKFGLERGCRNSTGRGAFLALGGTPSVAADDLRIGAFDMPHGAAAWLLLGAGGHGSGAGVPLGDGLLCVAGGLTRVLPNVVFEESCGWGPGFAGQPDWLPGTTLRLQVLYLEPASAGPCGSPWNFTQAVEVALEP